MKPRHGKPGLSIRLAAVAAAALLSQQALSQETTAGGTVQNTATVSYEVNGNAQAPIDSNTAEFVVDRRVDFTVTRITSDLTPTSAGDEGQYLEFVVYNMSNGELDFDLSVLQQDLGDGDIFDAGTEDTGIDMEVPVILVSSSEDDTPGTGDGPDDPSIATTTINNLSADASIRVWIVADTPDAAPDASIAGLELSVTAAAPDGTVLTESTSWTPDQIDNVFANASGADASGNATETAVDGFLIQSATITVTKSQAVIDNGVNNGLAIPGSVIEYTLEIENTGGVAAEGIVISD
ncbi:MAG: hypothetical protein JJ992_21835, partial [Planctomycetes bacterium]|nr:hypothetical protein [Planctomycetota bacterium]